MELTSHHVRTIFDQSLHREGGGDPLVVDSITFQFEFDRVRLKEYEPDLCLMLSQASAFFFEDRGGGHSHQQLCRRRDGVEWGDDLDVDKLVGMALGLELVAFNFPREAWPRLGDSAPYLKIRGDLFRLWAVLTRGPERFCWPIVPEDFPPPKEVSEEKWYQADSCPVSALKRVEDHVAVPLYDALVLAGHYVEQAHIPDWVKDPSTVLQVF